MQQGLSLKHHFLFQWLLALFLLFLTRLPYLLGPHVSFDGDEAIVGIMAQDLLAGKNIPVYFYGQQYGFSFFEVISTAIGILILGNTVWALKFGALLVFSVGITFLFKYVLAKTPSILWAIIIITIVILFPSWLIWSMKDRGGYVTAFSLSCIVFYITQMKQCNAGVFLLVTAITSLCFHAQSLIAISALMLLLGWTLQSKKKLFYFLLPLTLMVTYFIFKIPAYLNPDLWKLNLAGDYDFQRLIHFVKVLPTVSLGYHYYEMIFDPTRLVYGLGGIYFSISILLVIASLFNLKQTKWWTWSLLASMFVSIIILPLMRFNSYRYELGMLTAAMLLIVLLLPLYMKQFPAVKVFMIMMLISGILLSFTSRSIPDGWMVPEGNDMKLYNELVTELRTRNLTGLYSTDPLLQWQLNYYGFAARSTSSAERIDRYINKISLVDGSETAIVGYKGMCNQMDTIAGWHDKVLYVNEKYFIYPTPELDRLKAGGFQQP